MIFFCIRKYPDIDNFSPIIDSFKKTKIKITILNLNIMKNYIRDYRINFLLKSNKNLNYINLIELFNFNSFQKKFYQIVFEKNNKFIFRLIKFIINKFFKNYLVKLIFNKDKIKFKQKKIDVLVIDHLLPSKLFFFNLFFHYLKKNNVKIISLPAGLPLYKKHPKAWNIAKNEIRQITKLVDKIVLQHKFWDKEIFKSDNYSHKRVILGSPRYLNTWRKKLLNIIPNTPNLNNTKKIKIVYMDSNNPAHIDFQEKKEKLLSKLSRIDNTVIKFKPHPRSEKIYINLPTNIEICKKIESINLIKWADVVMSDISAIAIEVLLQNKRFINLKLLRKKENKMIYDDFKISENLLTINDLYKVLFRTKKQIKSFYSKKDLKKFLDLVVYYPDKDLLKRYQNIILNS